MEATTLVLGVPLLMGNVHPSENTDSRILRLPSNQSDSAPAEEHHSLHVGLGRSHILDDCFHNSREFWPILSYDPELLLATLALWWNESTQIWDCKGQFSRVIFPQDIPWHAWLGQATKLQQLVVLLGFVGYDRRDVGGIYKHTFFHISSSWLPSLPNCLRKISQASLKAQKTFKNHKDGPSCIYSSTPRLSGSFLSPSILFWTYHGGIFLKVCSRDQLHQNHLIFLLKMLIPGPYPRPTELDSLEISTWNYSYIH